MDNGKHRSAVPSMVVAAVALAGVGWVVSKGNDLQANESGVRLVVNTTADHERIADVEYFVGLDRDTMEDARLQWGKNFVVERGTLVGLNATKQGSDDPEAVFYCEIWVDDHLVLRREADDNNVIADDPPFVNCETMVLG